MNQEEMQKFIKAKFNAIDRNSAEGQLLSTAICLLGWAKFPTKSPQDILDLVKDCYLHPLINETMDQTFVRILEEKQKRDN